MRSAFVEEGQIPVSLQKALENTFVQKNPWGRSRAKRGRGPRSSTSPPPHVSETKSKKLLFTCCIQAYDPRCMMIPANVAALLEGRASSSACSAEEEACCGNEIRRIGEAGSLRRAAGRESGDLPGIRVQEIIALSPHCMNTLKKEYGDLGIRVSHYSEVLADHDRRGSLKTDAPYEKKVIYHDPCFLGKQNSIFDEPRSISSNPRAFNCSNFRGRGRPRSVARAAAGGCSTRRRGN